MEKEISKLEKLVMYTSKNKRVGHTFTALAGLNNNDKALFIVATRSQTQLINLPIERIISIYELDKLRGRQNPILIDHFALEMAYTDHISKEQSYLDNVHMKILDDLKDHYWNSLSEDKDLIIDHATKVIDKVFENY